VLNFEKMQALHDVVQAGYVRYIGMSSCWAYQCTYTLHLCSAGLMFVYCPVQAMQSQTSIGSYKHSADIEVIQTMRSQTTSLPSSPCKTTTVYSIVRRSARCFQLSRFFHCIEDISIVTHRDEDVWRRFNTVVSAGSWCPHTPPWTEDRQRSN
jgi:hypothetical protein